MSDFIKHSLLVERSLRKATINTHRETEDRDWAAQIVYGIFKLNDKDDFEAEDIMTAVVGIKMELFTVNDAKKISKAASSAKVSEEEFKKLVAENILLDAEVVLDMSFSMTKKMKITDPFSPRNKKQLFSMAFDETRSIIQGLLSKTYYSRFALPFDARELLDNTVSK